MIIIITQVVGLYFLLDFVTGIVHFWMDRYGKEDMPIVGKAVMEINRWHHEDPRKIVTRSYWYLCKSGWAGVALMWTVVFFITGTISWQWLFFGFLGANANIVHQWSHKRPDEKPGIVTFLQNIKVLQRPRDHAEHHTRPETKAYCSYTPWLNPMLDGIKFWTGMEKFVGFFGFHTNDRLA